jgi:hypothetical protein
VGMMNNLKIFTVIIVGMSISLLIVTSGVNGETYSVGGYDRNYLDLNAEKGDVAIVTIVQATHPLDILFMRLFKFGDLSWYGDNSDLVEQRVDGAIEGTWKFELPSNENWIVVFKSADGYASTYEVEITYDSVSNRDLFIIITSICCSLGLIVIIGGGLVGGVWYFKKKKKSSESDS